MAPFDRHLWRLAGRLAAQIAILPARTVLPDFDESTWSAVRSLSIRLREVVPRGWNAATDQLCHELRERLTKFRTDLGDALSRLAEGSLRESPSRRFIYEELVATRDEFSDFAFGLRDGTLTVTTNEIVLEGMSFGRFGIVLQLNSLTDNPYRIVAESPNTATSRSDITHPHVSSERLCEGDASIPLEQALRSGRFYDFFQIIQQTLNTYNSESPYVSIDDWDDSSICLACGCRVDHDESHYCDQCESTVCSDCSAWCVHCDKTGCDACLSFCSGCRDCCCEDCLTSCAGCAESRCPSCLTQSLCEDCHAETSTNDSERDTVPADATVQPDSLGQALVPT